MKVSLSPLCCSLYPVPPFVPILYLITITEADPRAEHPAVVLLPHRQTSDPELNFRIIYHCHSLIYHCHTVTPPETPGSFSAHYQLIWIHFFLNWSETTQCRGKDDWKWTVPSWMTAGNTCRTPSQGPSPCLQPTLAIYTEPETYNFFQVVNALRDISGMNCPCSRPHSKATVWPTHKQSNWA